jgi:hypothetical protein
MSEENIKKVQGKIIAETEKAVRIHFLSEQEMWIPKSTVASEFNSQRDTFQPFSIHTWVLEKNKILINEEQVIDNILGKVKGYHTENLIAAYGIGSAFDKTLPDSWIKNDLDLILVVKSLKDIPKEKWDKRFFPEVIEGLDVYTGYNTLNMYQDEKIFNQDSGANYKWALLEIKYPENSTLLYGEDIRNKLPDITTIPFDFDDILARGVYHLEKSLKHDEIEMRELSKGILKICFYICVYFVENFHYTSIPHIEKKLKEIITLVSAIKEMETYFEEAKHFRVKGRYKTEFESLRDDFIVYIIRLLKQGVFHKKFDNNELKVFLTRYFGGFPYLKKKLKL